MDKNDNVNWFTVIIFGILVFAFAVLPILTWAGCTESEMEQWGEHIQGEKGDKGDTGSSGNITTETATEFSGIIVGDGSNCNEITKPSGTVVGTTDTQELTNKTLDSATAKGTWDTSGEWTINSASNELVLLTTSGYSGIESISTYSGVSGSQLELKTLSSSPAAGDYSGRLLITGYNDNDEEIEYIQIYYVSNQVADGSEDARIDWWLYNNGSNNKAMTLSGAGILRVDDSFDTFDDYDDAELLRQGISFGDRELLKSVGVLVNKKNEEGQIIKDEYMIQLQALLKLVAGGVYQNRDYIEFLEARIEKLEERLSIK